MWSWFCKKYSCQILQKSSACISIETANNWILLCSQKYNERGLNLNFFSPYRCLQYWLGCRADTIRSLLSPTTLLCNGEQLANIKGICRKYEKRFGANMNEIWRKYQTDLAQFQKIFVGNITGICRKQIWKRFGANIKEIWCKYKRDSAQIWKRFDANIKQIPLKF